MFRLLVVLFILFVLLTNFNAAQKTQESELYKKLLRNYYPFSRPIQDPTLTLNIYFKLKLTQLVDLSAKENILTTSLWIEQVIMNRRPVYIDDACKSINVT